MQNILKKTLPLVVVATLSYWAIKPLFMNGYFPVHDATQVERVYEMAKALKEGQFPVRWVADLGYGYGYPIFNFYSPLPYYVGALLNILGLNLITATKGMFFLGIILSGFFMYLLAREFWGKLGGIISALFYIYAPYHALDIYVRGAVGEFWAIAFLPLAFYGLYRVKKDSKWQSVFTGALGIAGVILSHNITAMILFPILLGLLAYWVIGLFLAKKINQAAPIIFSLSLGLGLSAFFWLPAILEAGFTNVSSQIGGGADFRNHFIFLDQLWDAPWGFGGSAGRLSGLSFKIGKIHLLISLAVLILAIFEWTKRKMVKKEIFAAILLLVMAAFFSIDASKSIWEKIEPMSYIQYPWRFLIFMIFPASFLAGGILLFFNRKVIRLAVSAFLLLNLIFFNTKYFTPKEFVPAKESDFTSEDNLKWKVSKISDEYLPKNFSAPQDPNDVVRQKIELDPKAKLENLNIISSKYTFDIEANSTVKVTVKTSFFPGWRTFVDGKEVEIQKEDGIFNFIVPKGTHKALVKFVNTPIRTIGNILSVISLTFLIAITVIKSRKT